MSSSGSPMRSPSRVPGQAEERASDHEALHLLRAFTDVEDLHVAVELLEAPVVAHAGLAQVPLGLVQAGTALGLTPRQVLGHVKLPLALPTIMAGIKTSAVINVGTATIAAFIGAGGFGERISQGLALNDHAVLLAGALPAAALALAVHGLFEAIERSLWRPPR